MEIPQRSSLVPCQEVVSCRSEVCQMEEAAKETVIIVHGTYAAPRPGVSRWYQPHEGFSTKLNDALQKRGSAARCWAHCSQGDQVFIGLARIVGLIARAAASELGNYVRKLRNEGWCYHIVAHSHGGNVVVEALPQITTALRSDAPLGKIVTLGTPFMDTMSPILQRITSDRRGFTRNAWASLIFVMLIMVLLAASSWLANFTSKALGFAVAAVVVVAVILFVYFGGKSHTAKAIAQMQPKFLAIGSRMDEPWQLLHHMRNASNPMAVQTNLIRYLISSLQSRISRSQQVDRIYGAKSYRDLKPAAKIFGALAHLIVVSSIFFVIWDMSKPIVWDLSKGTIERAPWEVVWSYSGYAGLLLVGLCTLIFGAEFFSALASPYRWCAHRLGAIKGIFGEIATYIVRNRGWSVVLAIAMGLEGYRHQLPLIEKDSKRRTGEFRHIRRHADGCATARAGNAWCLD